MLDTALDGQQRGATDQCVYTEEHTRIFCCKRTAVHLFFVLVANTLDVPFES